MNLLVRSCSSLLLLAIRPISPAKRRLQAGVRPIKTGVMWSLRDFCIIPSRNMLNNVRNSRLEEISRLAAWS